MSTIRLPEWPWRVVRELARERAIKIWLVGGAVRDLLLERPLHDWDFAVDRDATTLARAVGDALGGFFFLLDEERGTARVVLETREGPRVELDFALLRGPDLVADLAERDFTINAMALDEADGLVDPLHGRADVEAGWVRAANSDVFRHDSVRLLRAARLEAELDFVIEPETEAWIRRDAPLLVCSAAERLRDELARGLAVWGASRFVRRLDDLGLLVNVVPDAASLKGVSQSYPHRFDVWLHTLHVIRAVEGVAATLTGDALPTTSECRSDIPMPAWGELARRVGQFASSIQDHLAVPVSDHRDRLLLLKLAALLHDIGKPQTQSVDEDGRIHFYGHESVGARMAARRMRALRFSREEALKVRRMTEAHLRPAHLARGDGLTRRAIYRYFRDTGDTGVDTVLLSLADHLATWGPNLREERWRKRLEVAELLLHHYFERPQEVIAPELPVDGYDLMRVLGLEPGPEIGRLLGLLQEAVAAGEVETREEMLDLARESAK